MESSALGSGAGGIEIVNKGGLEGDDLVLVSATQERQRNRGARVIVAGKEAVR